jgi:hypothetical protein
VLFIASCLVFLSTAAYATQFTVEFGDPAYFKYEEAKFTFAADLRPNEELLPDSWFFDVALPFDALSGNSAIIAGDSVSVSTEVKKKGKTKTSISVEPELFLGYFSRFDILQDGEGQFRFLGEFEYSPPSEENILSLYFHGNMEQLEPEGSYSISLAAISNFDPSTPAPESATMMLVSTGMLCIVAVRRKRRP